jgi:hypothetical protein
MDLITVFFYQVLGIWMATFLQYPWGSHLSLSNSFSLTSIDSFRFFTFFFRFFVPCISKHCRPLLNFNVNCLNKLEEKLPNFVLQLVFKKRKT